MDRGERRLASVSEEGRYRLLVDAVRDYAIYMLDADGIVTSWNSGARRFKGYEPEEIIGRHFSCFYTEEDRQAGLPSRALETSAREGKFEAEGWRVRKDGTRFWAHVLIDPILSPEGEVLGYAEVTRDLTEKKEAEEALRRNQEQFRVLVQGVVDYSIYMLDPGGRIASWNMGAERIKGYAPDEIIGEHFSRFYTPQDREAGLPERALRIAREVGRFENEGWRVRKDGSRFWAHVIVDAIRDEAGALIGFAKVTRDVTERREAQRALDEAREALFQAQKMEAIGQLTGGIAHDFNNLLTVILGSLDLVKKRLGNDPRITPLIDNAIQGARRGSALTQRMLAFARRQELMPVPVELPALIHGMSEMLQRSLGPAVPIEVRFPLALPDVLADPNQLELAVLNLVVNARDAMPNGGNIVISAREERVGAGEGPLSEGRYCVLCVTDTGEGMDEATLAKAVEPFFTTKGVGKGTGLGLSMVHGMAEQSGGRLALRSRKGEGTTAEIWLPILETTAPADHRPAGPEPRPRKQVPRLRVLAVDDDPLVLMNTVEMLSELGHTALEAASAEEALEISERDPSIDLVITDHIMPRMTGVELANALRDQGRNAPIIIATGYAELPHGADANLRRLPKPFSERELAEIIDEAYQTTRRRATLLKFPAR